MAVSKKTGIRYADLPAIPAARLAGDPSATQMLDAVRKMLDIRFGKGGQQLDKAVTWGDLVENGFASMVGPNGRPLVVPPGGTFLPPLPEVVDGVPPAPTNVTVMTGLASVIVQWDKPAFNYFGYAEVFRSTTNNLATAQKVGDTTAWLFADGQVGSGTTYYYWVRFISVGDKVGPYHGVSGVEGKVSLNPDYVLDLLNGQIGESQLIKGLRDRIDLIDGEMPGSVAARISAESEARAEGDDAVARSLTQWVAQFTQDNETLMAALEQESIVRASTDGGLLAQWTVKTQVNGRVTGFGFASTERNGVPFSEFAIVADRFSVVPPTAPGQTPKVVFAQAPVDGVSTTVIANAMIADAAISRAKIGLAAIDDARIANLSAVKVTFGEMSGDRIAANTLNADRLTTNTLAARLAILTQAYVADANIVSLNAAKVNFGQMSGDRVEAGSMAANLLNVGWAYIRSANIESLDAGKVTFGQMHGDRVEANTMAANLLNVATAYIKRANIQDLAVDTIKLAGMSVVVAASGEAGQEYGGATGNNSVTLAINAPYPCTLLVIYEIRLGGIVAGQTQPAYIGGNFMPNRQLRDTDFKPNVNGGGGSITTGYQVYITQAGVSGPLQFAVEALRIGGSSQIYARIAMLGIMR